MDAANPKARAEQAQRLARLMTNTDEHDRLMGLADELFEQARREEDAAEDPAT
jgi:hypothetical protein